MANVLFDASARLRVFFRRHPLLYQAILWTLPAVAVGAVLRGLLLWYSPYAYWGSDSRSYFAFAYDLLESGHFELHEKRRYVYPLFLFPISLLPGSLLQWLAWIQHALGLATLFALGYTVRKIFTQWRLWIVPLTVLYAGMPMIIWYEHELLGETLFYVFGLWTLAGWMAWTDEKNLVRATRLFWTFLVPFALLMLTKPSGRFFWPGILLALVFCRAWRVMKWPHYAALAVLLPLTFTMGGSRQGPWLLYNSAFPLTRLDTPLHAEYKAQIADLVTTARQNIGSYYRADSLTGIKRFLKYPSKQTERPLWIELEDNTEKRARIYSDLAKEGIMARPDLFLLIAFERILDSSNPDDFKEMRFVGNYFAFRLEKSYPSIVPRNQAVSRLFGLPLDMPPPPLEVVQGWVAPRPDSKAAEFMRGYVNLYNDWFVLMSKPPEAKMTEVAVTEFKLAPLGWWMMAGGLLSVLIPRFRPNLGIWFVIMTGYLFGVFLVGSTNPRFFGPAWPVLILLLAVPLDWVFTLLRRRKPVALPEDVQHVA